MTEGESSIRLFFFGREVAFAPPPFPNLPKSLSHGAEKGLVAGGRGGSSSVPTPQPGRLGEAKFRVVVPPPVANWDQWHCHHAGAVQQSPLAPHSHCQPRGKCGMRPWGFLGVPGVPVSAAPAQRDAGLKARRCRMFPDPKGLEQTPAPSPHSHISTSLEHPQTSILLLQQFPLLASPVGAGAHHSQSLILGGFFQPARPQAGIKPVAYPIPPAAS